MQQIYRKTSMSKCDFNKVALQLFEITLRHGCSPVNLLHIFRTPFLKNTSGWMLLDVKTFSVNPKKVRFLSFSYDVISLWNMLFMDGHWYIKWNMLWFPVVWQWFGKSNLYVTKSLRHKISWVKKVF